MIMTASGPLPKARSSTSQRATSRRFFMLRVLAPVRVLLRRMHPAWFLSLLLLFYILLMPSLSPFTPPVDLSGLIESDNSTAAEKHDASATASLLQTEEQLLARLAAARNASATTKLGNHFCVLQPTLSVGRSTWTEADARNHIALRAFMRTFAQTVTSGERRHFFFSIFYGHDSEDPVFGDAVLRAAFQDEAHHILRRNGFSEGQVRLVFTPLYALHGRINAIWNVLAKDAYYDGCDFFFLSNDDMVFFTESWVSHARDSLNGIGSPVGHKRPCRYFGIVRFKDEWASWATFTFHVSTRMHMEIFGGVYYPVPYNSAHNDYWINFVYKHFEASKYRGEVKVRNRVDDVDYALAHPQDTTHVAPPRYKYDELGDVRKYITQGRERVKAWLDKNRGTDRCPTPL